jgi:hypothetical protein
MSYFNTTVYDSTSTSFSYDFQTVLDGSAATIPVNGSKYYGNVFGNVMTSFFVDCGDSIFGGNVLVTNNISLAGGINILATSGTVRGTPTYISGSTLSYLSGISSSVQNQINNSSLLYGGTITGKLTINGNVSVSGTSSFNVGNDGQLIVTQPALTYSSWSAYGGTSGLQIGWNNDYGTGGTDFINNSQNGGGNPFSFWTINSSNQTASKIAAISRTGGGIFTGLTVNGSASIGVSLTLNGTTMTGTTLSYLDVTSSIQTQFNNLSSTTYTSLTTGTGNFAVGSYIGVATTSGSNNLSLAKDSLIENITGCDNITIGRGGGTGVMGSNCICIGTYSGLYSKNNYVNSTCLGFQSRITGSYQVVLGTATETILIPGAADISGNLNVHSSLTASSLSATTVTATTLTASSLSATTVTATSLSATTVTATSLSSTTVTASSLSVSSGGSVYMNDSPIYLHNDNNHGLQFNTSTNGPQLYGYAGGSLGIASDKNVLVWNSAVINMNRSVELNNSVLRMNGGTLFVGGYGDTTTTITSNSTYGGPALQGSGGGCLGTTNINNVLSWNGSGVNIVGNVTITGKCSTASLSVSSGGSVYMNDSPIYLHSDNNHGLQFNTSTNGPQLYGYVGGSLGIASDKNVLVWNSTTISMNRSVELNNSSMRMNGGTLYVGGYGDTTNLVQYNSGISGVSVQGSSGGQLGCSASNNILSWNGSGVAVTGSLQQNNGVYFNFYRKTSCSTSESYDFSKAHGFYMISFMVNHDTNTTGTWYLDVLNNVNGGSALVGIRTPLPNTLSAALNTTTNILTINVSYSGGTFVVHRMTPYN